MILNAVVKNVGFFRDMKATNLPLPLTVRGLFSILLMASGIHSAQAQSFTPILTGDIAQDSTNTNGASFIDYDNDGDLDLFLSNADVPFGFNTLYRNDGNDHFSRIEAGEVTGMQMTTFGHAWGDYDNDGLEDLFVVNAFTSLGSMLYKNLGEGKFRRNENYNLTRHTILGFAAAWSDFDRDGWLDLLVVHPAGGFVGLPTTSNFLFKNNGDAQGSFSPVLATPVTLPTAPFTNATWTDYDRDGDPDLFIGSGPANGSKSPDYLYQNQMKEEGKATFRRISTPSFARDSLDGQTWNWIDYDNDSDLDAYVTNWGGTLGGLPNVFYENRGDTILRADKGGLTSDIGISLANVWADFDNDADLDVYVGNGGNQPNRYYENLGNGSFKSHTSGHFVETRKTTWAITAGDYNNDGRMDLFVASKTGYVRGRDINFLYRNDTKNKYNWIIIRCVGKESNRSGIGTQVRLTATIDGKSVSQYREVGSNATFLGSNDRRVHFGLRKATRIDKIEFTWPSGQKEVYRDVLPNRILTATEGDSLK